LVLFKWPWKIYQERITRQINEVIGGPHPSPLSANRGFFGSRPLSKINAYLKE
jgi:uracil-DNA glycosylase